MIRFLLLACIVFPCCKPIQLSMNVNELEYQNTAKCWERRGKFEFFIVIHKKNKKYYPYFISGWCSVTRNTKGDIIDFNINDISGLEFDSDYGLLKKASLFDSNLESNAIDHVPRPTITDPVYVFSGDVTRLENDGYVFYRMTRATTFTRTELDLGSLIAKTPIARTQFFNDQITNSGHQF